MKINEPQFYTNLIRSLYDQLLIHPTLVQIEPEISGDRILFRVQGHATDQGLMIGAGGQNIKALQKVLATIGQKGLTLIQVKILEPYIGTKEMRNRPPLDPNWVLDKKDNTIANLLCEVCMSIYGREIMVETHHSEVNNEPTTVFTVIVPELPGMELKDAINTIFHAIGRAKGRNILVNARLPEVKAAGRARRAPARKILG